MRGFRFQVSVFRTDGGFSVQVSASMFLLPDTWYLLGRLAFDKEGSKKQLARIIYESVARECEDDRLTWQPQGLESEAYLNSTSQGSRPEDAR